jgi:hypothetical protein
MFRGLTGWALRYFAIVSKFKSKNKRFGSKKYGRADVMLWEKYLGDKLISAVTLRLHEEAELLWLSGVLTPTANIIYSTGLDATIVVTNKARGKLLDVSKMVAITSENEKPASHHVHMRSPSEAKEDCSDLVLSFESAQYRFEFVRVVEQFKATAAVEDDSVRRINSLASDLSPPMR